MDEDGNFSPFRRGCVSLRHQAPAFVSLKSPLDLYKFILLLLKGINKGCLSNTMQYFPPLWPTGRHLCMKIYWMFVYANSPLLKCKGSLCAYIFLENILHRLLKKEPEGKFTQNSVTAIMIIYACIIIMYKQYGFRAWLPSGFTQRTDTNIGSHTYIIQLTLGPTGYLGWATSYPASKINFKHPLLITWMTNETRNNLSK